MFSPLKFNLFTVIIFHRIFILVSVCFLSFKQKLINFRKVKTSYTFDLDIM